ncbi:MAG: transporter substrate-binding domain-containing protein [Geobacteraceae bacterium]|nr:transporter substrate-binding domain-containing protein [Geobacteraceae bacterium]
MNNGICNYPFQGRAPRAVLCGIVLVILALSTSLAQAANDKLLFLGNKNIAPVVYLDNGVPAGVAVDIVRALARYISQPVEIRAMDWLEAQALVARGDADVLIQINPTEERKQLYDFSDTLLESQFSIFTATDRVGISGISSLRGLRVGVESGGLPQQLLEKNPHIALTIIPDFLEGFKLLNQGTVDAVVVDYRVGSYVIAENKLRNIKVSGEPIAFSYSAFAVKKGNTQLLDAINDALLTMKADGTYQKILNRWKPKEVIFQTREQIRQRYYSVTILILLILFLIAALWMLTLKKELIKRKAAEEKLREQYSTLSSIINSANATIYSLERTYNYTSFNQEHAVAMKALYAAEIELGHSLLEYMSVPEERDVVRRNLDRALAGEQIDEESYSGEEHKSRHCFQISYSPIRSAEDVIGVAVFARDITERKRAEETLYRERTLLRCIIDSASDLIFIKNRDYIYLGCNKAFEQFIGLTESEQIGKSDFDFFGQDRGGLIRENDRQVLGGGKTLRTEEWVTYPDGSRLLLDAVKVPFYGADGEIQGLVGICRDITERKRGEEELARLNEELEQRVKQRTAELEKTNADLQKMNRLFVGRELRMVELKERIRELEGKTAEK